MKDKLDYSLDKCHQQLLTSSISEEVKREVLNYCDDKTEHSIYLITFKDLFHYVMNRILKHPDKDEIFKVLDEEIKDTICRCFTGRMTRLLNVLNGFYPDIKIQIGSNEQITNIILMLKEKYDNVDVLKEKVKQELEERGYEVEVIKEWIGFIE
jgi:SOS response regulatory protein OraA/RecX